MLDSLQAAYAELAESRFQLERRTSEIDEARELFEQVIDSMSEALFLLDSHGRIVRINSAAAALLEMEYERAAGTPLTAAWPDVEIPTTPWALVERAPEGALSDLDVEIRRPQREPVAGSASCALVRNKTGRITGLLVIVRDISERKRAESAVTFLAEASSALAASLEYGTTLRRAGEIAVRGLADWCLIDVVDDDGAIRRVTVAHADPQRADLAEAIAAASAIDPAAGTGVPEVIRARRARLEREPDPARLAADVHEPEPLRAAFAALRPVSWICAPFTGTRAQGAISLLAAESGRRYGRVDLAVAEELARRVALALDNARLYEVERDVAATLQRSLLPQRLPRIPGLTVSARYLPAHPTAVGGDWYDVIELPGGSVALVMGDVAGHGVSAAATMGRLRSALKAYVLEGHGPAATAERLNALIESSEMATLAHLVIDPATGEARYVLAAHPPPLVVEPTRRTRFLAGGSPPLTGIPTTYTELRCSVDPEATLLLYTDGLVEVRGEHLDSGLDRLAAAAARAAERPLEELLDALLEQVPPKSGRTDDLALLAMRSEPIATGPLHLNVDADPTQLRHVRRSLQHWLTKVGAETTESTDILVACSEACANAIEHAYGPSGGHVAVQVSLHGDEVSITVHDRGRWRAPRGRHRGRGTALMRALMDHVEVQRADDGTCVSMRRRLNRAR